jgi:5-formyltetrahydrofolate cyclo-ligase
LNSKAEWRKFSRNFLKSLENKKELESKISQILLSSFRHLKQILLYSALPYEISLEEFANVLTDARLFYPKILSVAERRMEFVRPSSWQLGSYGISEPVGLESCVLEEVDLCLMPCLGINANGFRLGQGGGYYDRFFTQRPSFPILAVLPSSLYPIDFEPDNHDLQVDGLVTEKGVFFLRSYPS